MKHTLLLLGVLTVGTALADTPAYVPLHRFQKADGYDPSGFLVRDSKGNLYGTTTQFGKLTEPFQSARGVVYKLDTKHHYKVLYAFNGGADGGDPTFGVILNGQGNIYGTTRYGGSSDDGVIFKLDRSGSETVLYNFAKAAASPLVRDSAGNLYGIAGDELYQFSTAGQFTVLYTFPSTDGGCASLIRDRSGNFYGACGESGNTGGVIYEVDANGRRTNLYTFGTNSGDGNTPDSLVRDKAGNLYGTTAGAGANNSGNIFKIDPAGNETILYNFGGFIGTGATPQIAVDDTGSVYGTTSVEGTHDEGTVYKVDASGNLTVLYDLTVGSGHYGNGGSGVIRDRQGNLYGTVGTEYGGVLFEIKQ